MLIIYTSLHFKPCSHSGCQGKPLLPRCSEDDEMVGKRSKKLSPDATSPSATSPPASAGREQAQASSPSSQRPGTHRWEVHAPHSDNRVTAVKYTITQYQCPASVAFTLFPPPPPPWAKKEQKLPERIQIQKYCFNKCASLLAGLSPVDICGSDSQGVKPYNLRWGEGKTVFWVSFEADYKSTDNKVTPSDLRS